METENKTRRTVVGVGLAIFLLLAAVWVCAPKDDNKSGGSYPPPVKVEISGPTKAECVSAWLTFWDNFEDPTATVADVVPIIQAADFDPARCASTKDTNEAP